MTEPVEIKTAAEWRHACDDLLGVPHVKPSLVERLWVVVHRLDGDGSVLLTETSDFWVEEAIATIEELCGVVGAMHDDNADYGRINNLGGYDNHNMRWAREALAKYSPLWKPRGEQEGASEALPGPQGRTPSSTPKG